MNNIELQDAIKNDILNISNLRFKTLSAKELYGSYLSFIFISSLVFFSLNILIHIVCHTQYSQHPSLDIILTAWENTFMSSVFLCIFFNSFILFFKLLKSQIKTADFLKKKCSNFCSLFVIIYSIIYAYFTFTDSSDFPDLSSAQIPATVGSLIFSMIILGIETNRLGIGALFDVIRICVDRISENNKEM